MLLYSSLPFGFLRKFQVGRQLIWRGWKSHVYLGLRSTKIWGIGKILFFGRLRTFRCSVLYTLLRGTTRMPSK
jgi:hypothetical protein